MHAMGSKHDQYWDAIPWIANGRAGEAEQQRFAQHAAECAECREELERQRHLHVYLRGTDDVIAAPHASWQKLLARIDAQADVSATSDSRASHGPRRWMLAAVWLQGIAIALLLALLVAGNDRTAPYTTLTSTNDAAQPVAIRVVFAPGTAVADINQLLRSVNGDIVAGPSEAGVYSLSLGDVSTTHVQQTIDTLRRHRGVVFAEPAQSLKETAQ